MCWKILHIIEIYFYNFAAATFSYIFFEMNDNPMLLEIEKNYFITFSDLLLSFVVVGCV